MKLLGSGGQSTDWKAAFEAGKKRLASANARTREAMESVEDVGGGIVGEGTGILAVIATHDMEEHKTKTRAGLAILGFLTDVAGTATQHTTVARAGATFGAAVGGGLAEQLMTEYRKEHPKDKEKGKEPKGDKQVSPAPKPSADVAPAPATKGELIDNYGNVIGAVDETGAIIRRDGAPAGTQWGVGRATFRHPLIRRGIANALARRGLGPQQAATAADIISTEADVGLHELETAADPDTSGDLALEGAVDQAVALNRLLAQHYARAAEKTKAPDPAAAADADDTIAATACGFIMPIEKDDAQNVVFTGADGNIISGPDVDANLRQVAADFAASPETGRIKLKARLKAAPKRRAIRKAARDRGNQAKDRLQAAQQRQLEAQTALNQQKQYALYEQQAAQAEADAAALEAQLQQPGGTYNDIYGPPPAEAAYDEAAYAAQPADDSAYYF